MTVALTRSQLRQTVMTVVNKIVADHTSYPLKVETANRDPIDHATQSGPYLQVVVAPMHGEQAELGRNAAVKYEGQILISAVVKDGAGTVDAEELIDFVLPYFSEQTLGVLQCQAAYPAGGRAHGGLWYESLIVPYFYFSKPV
jgi:hypothetical protein